MTLLVEVSSHDHTVPARLDQRSKIVSLESKLFDEVGVTLEPSEEVVSHHHADRLYGREMFIPKGSLIVGKIHRYECVNVIATGTIKVVSEWGEDIFVGPTVFVSPPGSKRAVLALTDVIWVTVHPNFENERDMDKLESTLIAGSYAELPQIIEGELV